jgi:hypothetical protein
MSTGRRRFSEGLRPSGSASGEREERGEGGVSGLLIAGVGLEGKLGFWRGGVEIDGQERSRARGGVHAGGRR